MWWQPNHTDSSSECGVCAWECCVERAGAICMCTKRFWRDEFVKHAILRRQYRINWTSLSFYFCVHFSVFFSRRKRQRCICMDITVFYSNCFSVCSLAFCARFNVKNVFTGICLRKMVHSHCSCNNIERVCALNCSLVCQMKYNREENFSYFFQLYIGHSLMFRLFPVFSLMKIKLQFREIVLLWQNNYSEFFQKFNSMQ